MSLRLIREEITEDDALAIVRMAKKYFPGQLDAMLDGIVDLVVNESTEIRRRPIFVAGTPNDLIGYVCGQRLAFTIDDDPYLSDSTVEVRSLAVAQEHRTQGYARALLDRAIGWTRLRRRQQLIAQVPPGMERLFESAGFTVSPTGWSWLESSSYSERGNKAVNERDRAEVRLVNVTPAAGYAAVAQANGDASLAIPFDASKKGDDVITAIVATSTHPEWLRRHLADGSVPVS
ncbi:GNAT family N-acetyltransferase [Leifsonia aquatica]|uniref:Acetyltransferase, GNAT family n=2 Tax=Leifsonia aquatica TaxID=144185 RepID=U2QDF6_LEIAQ|nr:GNAT family N-acetyltransferase [Leifsonia aquatica]ERK60900.1 acetyltransferase, GNAT family [Leifsonia aquatica ATCC 14665]MBB2967925.1 GNAT superfamily N-acetyltransferase [Leifsonia aquatica]